MMNEHAAPVSPAIPAVEHHLSTALASAGLEADPGQRVVPLNPPHRHGPKSAVFRVGVLHPDLESVVAKRATSETAAVERIVYEQILPHLNLSFPRFLGMAPEKSGDDCWLFLEFIDGPPLALENTRHRRAAAEWLAGLHTASQHIAAQLDLPDRGPGHFLRHLRSARTRLAACAGRPDLTRVRDVAQCLEDHLCRIEQQWNLVEHLSQGMPRTLVHGDIKPENIRVRERAGDIDIVPLDWEFAGLGVPAVDLAQIDFTHYRRLVDERWLLPDTSRIALIPPLGLLFRALAAVDWSAEKLDRGWSDKPASQLAVYADWIFHARQELRLA